MNEAVDRPETYATHLRDWHELGMTTIAISIVHHLPEKNRPIYLPHRANVPQLGDFEYSYPTSGSEEGIREYMSLLQSRGVARIYCWKGDYEGYREVARNWVPATHFCCATCRSAKRLESPRHSSS